MIRTFLSIPVQGSRVDESSYSTIIASLARVGLAVLNPEVIAVPGVKELAVLGGRAINAHNRSLLVSSELVVADISQPSLGVGYELAIAEAHSIPTIALCRSDCLNATSLMIRGIQSTTFRLWEYENVTQLPDVLAAAVHHWQASDGCRETPGTLVRAHFAALASSYDDNNEWRRDAKLLDWFTSRLGDARKCVDVGAGTGLLSEMCRRDGRGIVAVDGSLPMLMTAMPRVPDVVNADASAIPVRSGSCDAVMIRQLLHYLEDEGRCLREAHRILNSNGRILVAQIAAPTLHLAAWWDRVKRHTQPLRRRYHTFEGLIAMLMAGGFDIDETATFCTRRESTWPELLRDCDTDSHALVMQLFREAPHSVCGSLRLSCSSSGLAYDQIWLAIRGRRAELA